MKGLIISLVLVLVTGCSDFDDPSVRLERDVDYLGKALSTTQTQLDALYEVLGYEYKWVKVPSEKAVLRAVKSPKPEGK